MPSNSSQELAIDPSISDGEPRLSPFIRIAPNKLASPNIASTEVLRTSLLELLERSIEFRVVLFSAPAGFGKTTVMAQLRRSFEASSRRCSWVTLDKRDNDIARFLSCISAAIEEIQGTYDHTLARKKLPIRAHDASLMADEVLNQIAAIDQPFSLFLDDFDEITETALLHLTRELINNLPQGSNLILATRSAPLMGLGRLRALGHLLEIDEKNLRFSQEEAKLFLNERRLLGLSDQQIVKLHHKTEGWIAAMWLASSALLHRPDKTDFIDTISGSDRVIAQYLSEDVYENLPEKIRQFLVRTCVVDYMTIDLCDSLVEQKGSIEILEEIANSNLFIKVIEREEKTFIYHKLFLQFLRERARREIPHEIYRLHEIAAAWHQKTKHPVQAIEHWIEANQYDFAVQLINNSAEELLQAGRMQLLARWFQHLPSRTWCHDTYLSLIAVWAVCFTRGHFEAEEIHNGISLEKIQETRLLSHYYAQQSTLLVMQDRLEEAYEVGMIAYTKITLDGSFASLIFANQMAYICRLMGENQESNLMLSYAKSGGMVGDFNRMYGESVEGLIDLEEGRVLEAASRFRLAAASYSRLESEPAGSAWAGVLHAGALYQKNEIEAAKNLLLIHVPLANKLGMADHLIAAYRMLSRIAFAQGEIDEAFNRLAELEIVGQERKLVRVTCGAKLERARLLLLQGNLQGSRDELDRANNSEIWSREKKLRLPAHDVEFWQLAEIRWKIHAGRAKECIQILDGLAQLAAKEHRHRRELKILILKCIAEHEAGVNNRATLATLEKALRKAHSELLVRTFLDEGPVLYGLVKSVFNHVVEHDRGLDASRFQSYLDGLLKEIAKLPEQPSETPSVLGDNGSDRLTPKELRILSLLSEGCSNEILAEKLFVSTNTVRTHLRNINSKLKVSNRTEAVAVARKLGAIR
ncbi:MAG: hypothetical protein RJB15_915 [Pseudomonadota bacterium]|jgi:LuxR family maltose regulon positive regulatory protein